MKVYEVEVMAGELPVSHSNVSAHTPKAAAVKATGRGVRDRRSEIHWVRVTDQADRVVYKFAFG